MNYTDLNEDQKAEVRLVILGECSIPEDLVIVDIRDADYPQDIDVEELPKKYPTKHMQELFRESNLNDDFGPIPEDLVIDWKEILVDYWTDFPNGYWYAMVGCL